MSTKKHIILCGYNESTCNTIEELKKSEFSNYSVVLITEKEVNIPDSISYVRGEYARLTTLRLPEVNLQSASMCIVFSEFRKNEKEQDVDLRTIFTVELVETEYPEIHTIAEIFDKEYTTIILDQIEGDECIFKHSIDSNFIITCIKHPGILTMLYELFSLEGKKIIEESLQSLKLTGNKITFKKIRQNSLKTNYIPLGIIRGSEPILSPDNDEIILDTDRLIFIE